MPSKKDMPPRKLPDPYHCRVRDLGNGELFECLTDGSLLCRYNKRFLALAICQNPRRKDIVVCSGYS